MKRGIILLLIIIAVNIDLKTYAFDFNSFSSVYIPDYITYAFILILIATVFLLIKKCIILKGKLKDTENEINSINNRFSTIKKVLENEILTCEGRLNIIFKQSPFGIGLCDIKTGCIYSLNKKFEEIAGRNADELLDLGWMGLINKENSEYYQIMSDKMSENKIGSFDLINQFIHSDNKKVWGHITVSNIKIQENEQNMQLFALLDITDRKMREEQIEYLCRHDVLTGIFNRYYLEKQKELIDIDENLPISVITGDINGLKIINNAMGYEQGDLLIKKTANIIKECINDDDIIARTGGDEFLILLKKTNEEEARELIDNINNICNSLNDDAKNDFDNINVSFGYATKNHSTEILNEKIKEAESNMYRHKLLEQKSIHSSLITSMKRTMFERSRETKEHAERLIKLSKLLGQKLNLATEELDKLELFATLHDIGKISIDSSVLDKPGKLNEQEWEQMKKHCETGYRIAMASPELTTIAEYILTHHERWDGKGYPTGIAGERIPKLSRILSIVDAYDAMTHDRVYRKAMTKEKAIVELLKNAGSQFDPEYTRIFVRGLLEESV